MKKYILMAIIPFLLTGCVTKMIGGAVDIVTLGIVKNDVPAHREYKNQETTKKRILT